MKLAVKTLDNKAAGDVTVSEAVFGLTPRRDLLSRMVNWQLAKRQQGTHDTKEIGEIRGSGKKPWNQKGTGRARAGSNYSPHFRGGATVFGPTPRSHAHKLTKKVRALALRHALSAKQAAGELMIVDDLKASTPKTKELGPKLEKLGLKKALFIAGETVDVNFARAANNIPYMDVLPVQGANVYDILKHETLVLSKAALDALQGRLDTAKAKKPAATKKATAKKAPAKKTAAKKDDK